MQRRDFLKQTDAAEPAAPNFVHSKAPVAFVRSGDDAFAAWVVTAKVLNFCHAS
jgi:hypothetical protein